jgi:hypothetical protein
MIQMKGAMNRSKAFQHANEPLKDDALLHLQNSRIAGPLPFLNPTNAHFHHDARPNVRFKWTSRDNRKGRHAIIVPSVIDLNRATPRPTSSPQSVAHNIWRMFTYYPVWDISFDVAFVFTIGSVIWVVNAFFVWLPLVRADSEFNNEELYGGGITAFIGATVFEFGSFLLMVEAINENRTGCFGWALERAVSPKEGGEADDKIALKPSKSHCTHHHSNKHSLVGSKADKSDATRSWIWWPSNHDLRTHYLHSLGFLASLSQLLGATVFWISGLTALPGIYNRMSRPISLAFYWTPQVVGGLGFIISGTLFMLETQTKWWRPAPKTLGWWIGLCNLVGGVGFTMCPAFGYDEKSWAQWQACLSTFWYESLEKFPVEVEGKTTNT